MRINGRITYRLEHGDKFAAIISTWSVPYSAWMRGHVVAELEENGMPDLVSIELQVMGVKRDLPLPDADELWHWKHAWCEASAGLTDELNLAFVEHCLDQFWNAENSS